MMKMVLAGLAAGLLMLSPISWANTDAEQLALYVVEPHRYYVCYHKRKVGIRVSHGHIRHAYRIHCPYNGWYSLQKRYNNPHDRRRFRPHHVCKREGATGYKVFTSRHARNRWMNRHCGRARVHGDVYYDGKRRHGTIYRDGYKRHHKKGVRIKLNF